MSSTTTSTPAVDSTTSTTPPPIDSTTTPTTMTTTTTLTLTVTSSPTATTTTSLSTTRRQRKYTRVTTLGYMLGIPGLIITCISYSSMNNILLHMISLNTIIGPCLLLVGCLLIIGSVYVSLFTDRKSKNPRQHPNWNARVKKESETVSWVLIIVGSSLACTAFIPSPLSHLGKASLCIIALGEIVLILGLIWHFKQHLTNPNLSLSVSLLENFCATLGWGMAVPGICLSCVGWIRYNREIAGIIGVAMLSIACVSVAAAAITKWRSAAGPDASDHEVFYEKRAAIASISWLFFVCGIIMAPVGFNHRPVGEPLGIAGACLLGITFLGNIMHRCYYPSTLAAPASRNAQQNDDPPSYQVARGMPAPPPPAESNVAGSHPANPSSSDTPTDTGEDDLPPPPSYDDVIKRMEEGGVRFEPLPPSIEEGGVRFEPPPPSIEEGGVSFEPPPPSIEEGGASFEPPPPSNT